MIDRELRDVTEADLQRLIETPVMEGDRIEYKAQLALGNDDAKKKFLAGIASFANASGGDLIYGMEADNGRPVALRALVNFNADADGIRIRDLIRTGIAPPVFTAEPRSVSLSQGGEVLVIRVRRTWAGAHMVTYNGDNRFYTRHGGGRRMMDVGEIHTAFTIAEGITERIQRLRLERLNSLLADETPCPVEGKAALVFHIVPLRAFDPAFRADLTALETMQVSFAPISSSLGCDMHREFDGVYVSDGVANTGSGYVYVFQNGAIEVVDKHVLRFRDNRLIPSRAFEDKLLKGFPSWLAALRAIGAEPPVVLMLTFLNVRGYNMGVNARDDWSNAHPISRDHLIVPGTVLESLAAEGNGGSAPNVLRPHFDAI